MFKHLTQTLPPVTMEDLPPDFEEVMLFRVTARGTIIWLNIVAVGLLVIFLVIFLALFTVYHALGGPLVIHSLPDEISTPVGLVLVLLMLPLHELIHGYFMSYFGHKPRYGFKLTKGILYATSDGALFRRDEYIIVAMAPFVVISLVMIVLSLFVPAGVGFWLMFAAVLNATGAAGDFWMTRKAMKFPADALIRDEKDGMRVFAEAQTV
jgi:hypothetical protein